MKNRTPQRKKGTFVGVEVAKIGQKALFVADQDVDDLRRLVGVGNKHL